MKKILIANRGEIACRIIESCKKLNIHSIAVYSDIDKKSKHVRLADEAIHIGNSKAQESYLSSRKIINAALKTKADAIHPGYGFLSENAEFAQNIIDAGLIWIGPKPNSITSMGNKDIARELAIKSNLPICPGLKNDDLNSNDLEKKCTNIGYPILIKASAGGGGIGMQIVNNFNELKSAVDKTKNLAKKAFGNSDIFLEKFIRNSRHIEIQVFGYGEKSAVHFYERDCSIQRRFQKIIEESPAPKVDQSIIKKMAEMSVKFASDQKYEGAGTIEFTNNSVGATFYSWVEPNGTQYNNPNPTILYNFPDDGTYTYMLFAYNDELCVDSASMQLVVNYRKGLFVPNAMYIGHADFEVSHFIPKGSGMETYHIEIFDTFGNVIWESDALDDEGRPTGAWDGKFRGITVEQDVYIWKVEATFKDETGWEGKYYQDEDIMRKTGTVTVIR